MAHIPSFEEILLEIHQSLGLERPQSKYIQQFSQLGMPLQNHQDMSEELFDAIFSALDMDEQSRKDSFLNMIELMSFNKAVELKTWTGTASQQQVLWHLLAYVYVPHMARRVSFWSLSGFLDTGMPGGEFWFLPKLDPANQKVDLPVKHVLDWLLDLLGESSMTGLAASLDQIGNADSILRTLQNWRFSGVSPKSAKKIEELFHDAAKLDFKGCITLDELSLDEERLSAAMAFVHKKNLDATALSDQIPMSVERLERVLNKQAEENENIEFCRQIAERYAKPSMPMIRLRLKVARMAQDGYERLLKVLCPGVELQCGDPEQNKLLQLLGQFQTVYNLTIEANKQGNTIREQDRYFENRLAPWDKADLLLSIVPSVPVDASSAMLAERLTRKFMELDQQAILQNLVPFTDDLASAVIQQRILQLKLEQEERERINHLTEQVRRSSPWRALQSEHDYLVVCQIAADDMLSVKIREMAGRRMCELARGPVEHVEGLLCLIGLLLIELPKKLPTSLRAQVQSLLDEAENSPGYGMWKAPLLRLKGKHFLMQNQFDMADRCFDEALTACLDRNYGSLRGEIARDAFAVSIVNHGFKLKTQEKYYRNMAAFGIFPDEVPSFEDTAVWSEEFFWSDLYRPYPGIEPTQGIDKAAFDSAMQQTETMIKDADWIALSAWLSKNKAKLSKVNAHDARQDSLLLRWLKALNYFKLAQDNISSDHRSSHVYTMNEFTSRWRKAIRLLLEVWPGQAKITDFKGQTPLMLAADGAEIELVSKLASISDIDAQDYLGRTALHAAVTGRSVKCLRLVLDQNPNVLKVTNWENNTALHTAVRCGAIDCIHAILNEFPGLAWQKNALGETPLEAAQDIYANYPAWQNIMFHEKNRRTGSAHDFAEIIDILFKDKNR